jgi:hypothetical protein
MTPDMVVTNLSAKRSQQPKQALLQHERPRWRRLGYRDVSHAAKETYIVRGPYIVYTGVVASALSLGLLAHEEELDKKLDLLRDRSVGRAS